jgi:starvation-inducible DNA-binding protein
MMDPFLRCEFHHLKASASVESWLMKRCVAQVLVIGAIWNRSPKLGIQRVAWQTGPETQIPPFQQFPPLFLACRKIAFFRRIFMAKKPVTASSHKASAQPHFSQKASELQAFGTVTNTMPLQLEQAVRLEMTEQLNQMLADTMTLRDLYKKSHWQVSGATFYQLHLLFDKHYEEQSELVDTIAERIQLLGGISIAMAADVAELTRIPRPPKGREEVPVQLSRLLDAHQVILSHCRELSERADKLGDAGTNDMVVSDVLRTGELQVWFVSEHLVEAPLVEADDERQSA